MYTVIDGNCFKNMLVGAYQLFQKKYEIINQLNVFPVPDGDTGNNMLNTLKSMYSMIAEVSPEEPVGIIAEKASAGAIMGARGNSGVILSQIIHGISRGLHGKKTASCGQMSKAFQYGILYAYRAVTKPVEGTILSVARGIAKGTHDVYRVETDFSKILEASIDAGEEALAKTPEQLQILKDANVVDADGEIAQHLQPQCPIVLPAPVQFLKKGLGRNAQIIRDAGGGDIGLQTATLSAFAELALGDKAYVSKLATALVHAPIRSAV